VLLSGECRAYFDSRGTLALGLRLLVSNGTAHAIANPQFTARIASAGAAPHRPRKARPIHFDGGDDDRLAIDKLCLNVVSLDTFA
jgi:hypothetical protein